MRNTTKPIEEALQVAASSADISEECAATLLAEHNRLVRERTGAKPHWKKKGN